MKRTYVKTPTIYQMEGTECGAASLSMIMAYYGKNVPLDKVRVDTGVSRDGCKASKILQGARKYGFDTSGRRMSLKALIEEKEVPCIIHWNFNHFVVYEGIKNNHAYINDPAQGRRKLTIEELDEGFTGIVLKFKPNSSFKKEKQKNSLFGFVKDRLNGQKLALTYLILIGICLIVPGLLSPIFTQIFLDDILLKGNTDWLIILLIAMVLSALFNSGFTFYRNIILQRLSNKMSLISGHKFISHMLRLPMSFFDQRFAGDLAERVNNNNKVCEFIAGDLAQNILNIFVSLFYLILLLFYSPTLTFVGICNIVLNFVIIKITSEKLSTSMMKMMQDEGTLNGVLVSGISMIDTLKASGVENEYVSRVLGNYAKSIRMEQEYGKIQQILNSIPQITNQICNVLVMMIGGCMVINGNLTVGMLMAFNSLLGSFTAPVNELITFVQKIQEIKADISRVDDILRYEEDNLFKLEKKENIGTKKLSGDIRLENISFGYSLLEKPLIEDFSFNLTSGKSIAFVGASGCGKSTISKVISSLYLPWNGKIIVDGMDLHEVQSEIINSSISTVSQEITIFEGTIRDNLTMWNRKIRDEDIIQATKDACIHDMITKKDNAYDFVLTEGGTNISGGQRQRLEIARALVTNPTILVMDEATSALDAITEKNIIDNIKRRGCTCIIVAHRLSAIIDCDEIIVMEKGKIVQRGNHETLIKQEGHYQKLVKNI